MPYFFVGRMFNSSCILQVLADYAHTAAAVLKPSDKQAGENNSGVYGEAVLPDE